MTLKNNLVNKNNKAIENTSQQFIQLFEADRKRIYAYIYAYVMDKSAADDIFQETSIILWREFEKFEPHTSFSKWANGIVFNRVRVYRRQNNKLSYGLSESLMNEIADAGTFDSSSEQRWNILESCRAQLLAADQILYENFYLKNLKAQEIADKTGRSIFAIRKSVHKLRKKLFDCVDRKKHEGLF
ncbi:sigma-70 family RNA polymerase sigma factor [Catenovulum adriaticum]|uniref:Sigma-70 family RNA polymerase sigma factor n=1 Tax=Catenovulum adriaticum TaxID=2984846 RepID=A0ABY7ATV9_9ALTE|nr:sigma-70 family RNA polymerase sigma factor [Catenovulum sp. TS8]WAJ71696.1 sigma-70 family RNA polymerase sigma factor [Catenovulum sp. TS8]